MNKDLLDLVYLCHSKDRETLLLAIKYAKKNVKNLRNIYIVSKTKITNEGIWINENIFPFTYKNIVDQIGDHFRTGWYYQQLIKLHIFTIKDILDNILICDSDTFFIKPILFVKNGIGLLNISFSDGSPLYLEHMINLLDIKVQRDPPISGICHHILMNKKILKSLKEFVEKKFNKIFWIACIDITKGKYKSNLPKFENMKNKYLGPGRMSEYEIYFNYALKFFPNDVKIRKLRSILAYKEYLNIKNRNFIKEKAKSRTNTEEKTVDIIPEKKKNKEFNSFEDCINFHIKYCVEKNFDTVTFQNHTREGSGAKTNNSHGKYR